MNYTVAERHVITDEVEGDVTLQPSKGVDLVARVRCFAFSIFQQYVKQVRLAFEQVAPPVENMLNSVQAPTTHCSMKNVYLAQLKAHRCSSLQSRTGATAGTPHTPRVPPS